MTKKKLPNQKLDSTYLIKSHENFKEELEERIVQGKELILTKITTSKEFTDLKDDFSHWHDYNLELLKQSFSVEYNEYRKSYSEAGMFAGMRTITKGARPIPQNEVENFKSNIRTKVKSLEKLLQKIPLLKSNIEDKANEQLIETNLDKTRVFIVHGHDEAAKSKAARFVEKLGLKAIILHEQASSSKTIIEKIEEYSDVGFGIILYTPCDIGGKNSKEPVLKSRARQNVIFEHGFLIGKIGRSNVCALVKGEVEIPNDISGVVYVDMDNGDAWSYSVARELKKSGYKIDMNKL